MSHARHVRLILTLAISLAVAGPATSVTAGQDLSLGSVSTVAVDSARQQVLVAGLGVDSFEPEVVFTDYEGAVTDRLTGLGDQQVRDIVVHGGSALLATSSEVTVVDLATRRVSAHLDAGTDFCVGSLAMVGDRLWAADECGWGEARLGSWSLPDGSFQAHTVAAVTNAWSLRLSPASDDRLAVVDVSEGVVHVLDVRAGARLLRQKSLGQAVQSVAPADDGRAVAARLVDGTIDVVSLDDATVVHVPTGAGLHVLALDVGGASLAVIDTDADDHSGTSTIQIVDMGDGSVRRTVDLQEPIARVDANALAMTADASRLFVVAEGEDLTPHLHVIDDPLQAGAVLTLSIEPDPPRSDRPNTLRGTLTTVEGSPLSGRSLTITEEEDASVITAEATVTTGSSGNFAVEVTPQRAFTDYRYRVSFAGDWSAAAAVATLDVRTTDATTNLVVPTDLGTDARRVGLAISQLRFADQEAIHAVVARGDDFADSLAGTPLLRGGPLLHTIDGVLTEDTLAELARVLPADGTVYVLGGTAAVPEDVVVQLADAGYRPQRLAGANRIETSIAIGDVVAAIYKPAGTQRVVLARAFGTPDNPTAAWADSVTGGAMATYLGHPVLVTPTDHLDPDVLGAIRRYGAAEVFVLGGQSALSAAVEDAIAPLRLYRLAGADRAATAMQIAAAWPGDFEPVLVNAYVEDGWRLGLAAAALQSPMLVVNRDTVPSPTIEWVTGCHLERPARILALGFGLYVTQPVVDQLDATPTCAG